MELTPLVEWNGINSFVTEGASARLNYYDICLRRILVIIKCLGHLIQSKKVC
jgi:hypothetical protein